MQAQDAPSLVLNLDAAVASLEQTIAQQQQALDQAEQSLIDQGATDLQLDAWEQQHASLFAAQDDRCQLLSAYSFFKPQDYITDVILSDDSSLTLENFLVCRAKVMNEMVQIHNQLVAGASISSITPESAISLQMTADEIFREQHEADFQAMRAQSRLVGEEGDHRPWPIPEAFPILPGMSPERIAYLTLKNQLLLTEVSLHNQYCAGDLKVMNAKIEEWHQQQEVTFQELHRLSSLSAPSTSTSDSP